MIRTQDPGLVSTLAGADLSVAVAEPLHVFLEERESLGCFVWRGPGIYEIHLAFQCRGRAAIDLFNRMVDTMRSDHGARFFWAAVPVESRHIRLFARLVGFKPDGIVTTQHGQQEIFVSSLGADSVVIH